MYSIIPVEKIFENNGDAGVQNYVEMEYKGEKILASPTGGNRYVIGRLISTSPKAFLDPELQPGTVIYK